MIISVRLKGLKYINVILSLQLWCTGTLQMQFCCTLKWQFNELEAHKWRSSALHYEVQCYDCGDLGSQSGCWCDSAGTEDG